MDGYGHSLLRRFIAQKVGSIIDFALILFGCLFYAALVFSGPQGIEQSQKSGILQAAEEVVRAGVFS